MAGGRELFAVGCGQPGAQEGGCGALGEAARLGELADGRADLAEVDQDECLLRRGVREQVRRTRLVGRRLGALVVVPRLADGVAVERFPSGERGCLGEHPGELDALPVHGAVAEQLLDLLDRAAELVQNGDPTEPAVDVPRVLDLLAEQLDGARVDRPRDGRPCSPCYRPAGRIRECGAGGRLDTASRSGSSHRGPMGACP